MKNYQVIEDNGGGLALVVYGENGKVEYMCNSYEFVPGQLTEGLQAIKDGADPAKEWDGNIDPEDWGVDTLDEVYATFERTPCAWETIADNDGIYPDKMGRAGKLEFGIKDD